MSYAHFKSLNPDWDFDAKEEEEPEEKDEKKKYIEIWNLIGNEVCSRRAKSGQSANFKKAKPEDNPRKFESEQVERGHFIIMLDASGSMSGNPWNQLVDSVRDFLGILQERESQMNNAKVSIIRYSSMSEVIFREITPDPAIADQIEFTSGGTDFEKPLVDAYNLIQETADKFDKFVLYFMSDGLASYPRDAVMRVNSSMYREKVDFSCIAFGNGADSSELQNIAMSMPKGKFGQAQTEGELKQSMWRILVNVFNC